MKAYCRWDQNGSGSGQCCAARSCRPSAGLASRAPRTSFTTRSWRWFLVDSSRCRSSRDSESASGPGTRFAAASTARWAECSTSPWLGYETLRPRDLVDVQCVLTGAQVGPKEALLPVRALHRGDVTGSLADVRRRRALCGEVVWRPQPQRRRCARATHCGRRATNRAAWEAHSVEHRVPCSASRPMPAAGWCHPETRAPRSRIGPTAFTATAGNRPRRTPDALLPCAYE